MAAQRTNRHPCPNCGKLRLGPNAPCSECYYPKHERKTIPKTVVIHPPFQFHILTLLACTAFAAIICSILKKFGTEGLWLTLELLGIFAPLIEFGCYFWINLRTKNGRDS